MPLALEKMEGPACALTFLGIYIDTVAQEIRLPEEKLAHLVRQWRGKKACLKRELLSLIGQLQHACWVVKPGRSFLHRMIDLSTTACELHHHIRLNSGFRSDLEWWARFLAEWNGVQMMATLRRGPPTSVVTSDASGWGAGAFSSAGEWFQYEWPESWATVHITVKELAPVVLACALWGSEWQGQRVECRTDNAAVVAIINKGNSKVPLAMHLMHSLFFFLAHFHFTAYAVHLPGVQNEAADALSRNDTSSFFQQVPMASRKPVLVPLELMEALIFHQGLDLQRLEESVRFFFKKGLADSTHRTYRSGKRRYTTFCIEAGIFPVPVPVCEQILCSFVAYLGLKYRTIKVYLSSVRHLQIEQALPDLFAGGPMARLEYVTRGIKKREAEVGRGERPRLPITLPILRQLKAGWEPTGGERDTKMLWAASALCFFAFLQVGEMTVPGDTAFDPAIHLSINDLAVDNSQHPKWVRVSIKQSKTDPFRRGVDVFVGRSSSLLCPVAAVLDYLCLQGMEAGPWDWATPRLLRCLNWSMCPRASASYRHKGGRHNVFP